MTRLVAPALLLLGSLMLGGCARRDYDGMCKLATEILGEPRVTPDMRFQRFVLDAPNSVYGSKRRELVVNLASLSPDVRYDFVQDAASEDGLPNWSCPALRSVLNPPVGRSD
jgi:hypothetical protein